MTGGELTRAEFLRRAGEAAVASAQTSGFPPGIAVAQAALESAWGRSRLATEAHNYFGIKAHGGMPYVALPTTEVIGGRPQRVHARFARYESMADCFRDRDAILTRVALYAEARAAAREPQAFARALARHWATDPEYAEKLLVLYHANGLFRLDLTQGETS